MGKLRPKKYWESAPEKLPSEITYNGKKYKAVMRLSDELQLETQKKYLKRKYQSVISKPLKGGVFVLYAR